MKLKLCPKPGCTTHISPREKLCARHLFAYVEALRARGIKLEDKHPVKLRDEKDK